MFVLVSVFAAVSSMISPSAASADAPVTTISARPTSSETVVGRTVLVIGTVTPADATPRVVLQRRVGGRWLDRGAGAVDADSGWYGIAMTPSDHERYELRVRSDGGSVVSPSFTVLVHARPTTISARISATSIFLGQSVVISGAVIEPDALRRVVLQRRVGSHWEDRGTASVDQRTGRYSMTITPTEAVTYALRMRSEGGTKFSPPVAVRVRHRPSLVITYDVATRGRVSDVEAFARHAQQSYDDARGWSMGGSIEFRRVVSGGSFTLVLAEAGSVPSFGSPCDARWSCHAGRFVVINDARWTGGAPGWSLSLDQYRHMVVNHETGHWLGLGHAGCSGAGALAPVMMQQSKATYPCANNPWPLPSERQRVASWRGVPIYS